MSFFHFAGGWRYMLEAYTNLAFKKYSYLILSNNLQSDMNLRLYSQIFKDEQLVVFKKLKSSF